VNATYCLLQGSGGSLSAALSLPDMEPSWADPKNSINAAGTGSATIKPQIIAGNQRGTYSVNYRNEPMQLRLTNPADKNSTQMDPSTNFVSMTGRLNPNQACQPNKGNVVGTPCGEAPGTGFKYPAPLVPFGGPTAPRNIDPYTPMLRAYQGDRVQIRTLVGAHLSFHSFQIPGLKWLNEPTSPNSGFKSLQGMGLSEHYEMLFDIPFTTSNPIQLTGTSATDYVYQTDSGVDGTVNGTWGILRAFDAKTAPKDGYSDLKPLLSNPIPNATAPKPVCPPLAPQKQFNVVAVTASSTLPSGAIVYNSRNLGQNDSGAILYVQSADLTCTGSSCTLTAPIEPLILRANAGDCINITLTNNLPSNLSVPVPNGIQASPKPWTPNINPLVGLVPAQLTFDPNASHGAGYSVGFNNPQTVAPGKNLTYQMYAGNSDGKPIELRGEFERTK